MPACVGQPAKLWPKHSANDGKPLRRHASDIMANIHLDKRPLREKHPGIPELSDRLARIAKQPNNDREEREVTEAIWQLAALLKERFYRPDKSDPYEVPEISTSGLSPYVREIAETRWG